MVTVLKANVDKAAERERLDKQIAECEAQLRATEARLNNPSFVSGAPAAVVEEHRRRQKDFGEELSKLKQKRQEVN